MKKIAIALSVLISLGAAPAVQAADGQFVFTVGGVPAGDVLNVRSKPKASAPIVGTMQNGEQGFALIYDCWNSKTGKKIKQTKVVLNKPYTWCAVMNADDTNTFTGYARAKFLK